MEGRRPPGRAYITVELILTLPVARTSSSSSSVVRYRAIHSSLERSAADTAMVAATCAVCHPTR
jgi:hypothetical protein